MITFPLSLTLQLGAFYNIF